MTQKEILAFRAKAVCDNLRLAGDGADIHEVDNLRHTAQLLLDALEDNAMDEESIRQILIRIEKQMNDYFIKKYVPWRKN
jgi:hypothetical protein